MKLEPVKGRPSAIDFSISDPVHNTLFGHFRGASPAESKKAVNTARQTFDQGDWSRVPVAKRVEVLKKIRREFHSQAEDLAEITARETGKVMPEILGGEIIANIELLDFYIKKGPSFLEHEKVAINPLNYPGKKGHIEHRPVGLVGILSSWNYPVALPMRAIVPALLAGNCVLFKPSEEASLTGQKIAEIFQAHLPPGVFHVLYGGKHTSQFIIDHADKINFIGSVGVGRLVAERCAARFIPCSTELSGKDAAIVLEDCDFERTVNGVLWGAFTNTGQNCASVERAYVSEKIYDKFLAAISERAARLEAGVDYGPLKNKKQLKLVTSHIREAEKNGHKIITGGSVRPGSLYLEPTIIKVNKRADGEFLTEETFGPTLPVIPVKDFEEAIELTNSSKFGLTTSVWTGNIRQAGLAAGRIESGVITINNCVFTGALAGAPWGGVKNTGHGVTNSKYGLLEMTRPHFVLTDTNKAAKETFWYPYGPETIRLMKLVLETMGGKLLTYLKIPLVLKKVLAHKFGATDGPPGDGDVPIATKAPTTKRKKKKSATGKKAAKKKGPRKKKKSTRKKS